MKWFGVILFALLVCASNAHAGLRCENLFSSSSIPQKLIQKIDRASSIKYDQLYSFIPLSANLTPQSRVVGYNFLKNYRYFAVYKSKNEISDAETLDYGDKVFDDAIEFLKTTNIKYKLQNKNILGVLKREILILPEGNHPLNIEAKEFKRETGTKLVFSPHSLLAARADAQYSPKPDILYVSSDILVNGSVKKDPVGKHEIAHIYTELYYYHNIPYLYHGLTTTDGKLPGSVEPYLESLPFDELRTHEIQTQEYVRGLIDAKKSIKKYSEDDLLSLSGVYRANIESTLANGYGVANALYQITTQSLALLRNAPETITFTKKRSYYHASMKIEAKDSKNDYVNEVPLLALEELSREELLESLELMLSQQQVAALYYRNVFKVGIDLSRKNKSVDLLNLVEQFESYQKILEKKYSFSSLRDVPTQKELAQSLK